tara:strand:+ start:361 stop:669 length:309 start_codon:yes stop_codon:yes gene_type:complete
MTSSCPSIQRLQLAPLFFTHTFVSPSCAQVTCSWAAVKLCGLCGLITVDALEWRKLGSFFFVSVAFLAAIFANIKTLQCAIRPLIECLLRVIDEGGHEGRTG